METKEETKVTDTSTIVDTETKTEPEVKVDEQIQTETKTEEPVKTETKDEKEIMIPKERFDEVNNKYKGLQKELDDLKAEAQKPKEEKKEEKVEKEPDAEPEVNPQIEALQKQLQEFQGVVDGMVTQKTESIPEEMRDLIPEGLTAQQKLDWINKAEEKGLFKKQSNVTVGQPLNHSSEQETTEKMGKMNPLQLFASYYTQK